MKDYSQIVAQFVIEGVVESIAPLGEGFINDTFTVKTQGEAPNYILQRKNHMIFTDVPAMMNNIDLITAHLKKKVEARGGDTMREVMTINKTKDGDSYYKDSDGNFWTMCVFIKDSVTYDTADSLDLCFKGGVGIGSFQTDLVDFEPQLAETIKGFHNIRWRFVQWDETIAADKAGRVAELAEEISWIESRREEMLNFWSLVENGQIPTRVTHNDTKLSNVLFDKDGSVLCMIDLDTVMSSTSLNDFGDAIRSYTNTGAEDDKDLDNVSMNIERFEAYAKGFLSQRGATLTPSEVEWLAFSAKYITYEQVLRFLMDYIDGDNYYRTAYDNHNLVRTHAQYKLLQSIEEQYEQMCTIIKENV
ncbi:MAG: aminoglycoside phosphotransferase family protein [Rikenellaceae bacterium]